MSQDSKAASQPTIDRPPQLVSGGEALGVPNEGGSPAVGEAQWHAALDCIADAILIFDVNHRVTYANAAAARMCGLPREKIIGTTCCALFAQTGWIPDEALYATMLKSGLRSEREFFSPGRNAWYYSLIEPIADAAGRRIGTVHRLRDISGRKETRRRLRASETLLSSVFTSVEDPIVVLDTNLTVVRVNRVVERLFSPGTQLVGRKCHELLHGRDVPCDGCAARHTLVTGETTTHERSLVLSDGQLRRFDIRAFPLRAEPDGEVVGVVEISRDVTEERRAREKIAETAQRYRLLFDQAEESIVLLDPETTRFVAFNRKAHENLGYTAEEFRQITIADVDVVETAADTARRCRRITQEGFDEFLTRHRTMSGEVRDVHIRARDVLLDGKKYIQSTWRDITEQKRLEESLQALTLVDDLTGLYNRRGFMTLAEQQLKIANRSGRDLFLLFADLDNLKWTNDRCGHPAGDAVLCAVARILKAGFRDSDIIARMGGDEFVVLMVESGLAVPDALVARLRASIEAHNAANSGGQISLSIGVARYFAGEPCSLESLLRKADALMYEEKRHKRSPGRGDEGRSGDGADGAVIGK